MKAKFLTKETVLDLGIVDRGFDKFEVGNTIIVGQKIKESDKKAKEGDKEKERIQYFEGDVIAISENGIASTFTVRRIASDRVAVERIFPYYSPLIDSIKFVRKGKVRRAKLYYIRKRIGKAARVPELVLTREEKERIARK